MFDNITNIQLENDLAYCYDLYRDLNEYWMEIEKYENYSVSIFGRVRNAKTGRLLLPVLGDTGYYRVHLCNGIDNHKKFYVHRLVANAFLHNHKRKPCVDHIDNDKKNNNVNNLRWCTIQENNMKKSKKSTNTSGYTGVTYDELRNEYRARIKGHHIGRYKSAEEAHKAYQVKALELFGEFYNASKSPVHNAI